jgi:hypothetical protein
VSQNHPPPLSLPLPPERSNSPFPYFSVRAARQSYSATRTPHPTFRSLSSAALGWALIVLSGLVSLQPALSVRASEPSAVPTRSTFLLVTGAPGDQEYGSNFMRQADLWQKACSKVDCRKVVIGLTDREHDEEGRGEATPNTNTDFALLHHALDEEPKEGAAELWIVLIGHGTFDGKEARFNLRGPDVSATDLAGWLKPFHRPIVLIDTASSSAPFLNKLSATNRVIVTATRSGNEQNFARFGQYFAEAITSTDADLDKDGQVSVLEAFLIASRKAAEFYKLEGRLVTEHALIDDNGDGLGTPADWFRGLRAVKKPQGKTAVDGLLAQQICIVPSRQEASLSSEQRAKRDALEREILLFREKKTSMPENDYYRQLEKLLLDYARFYESLPATAGNRPDS